MKNDSLQKFNYSFLGIMIVCTLSILFYFTSTFLLYKTKEEVSTISQHSYAVSNTAREIHARSLDMNFFYRKFLSSEATDKNKLALIVHERILKLKIIGIK